MLNREHISDAVSFWEPARIGYNLVLALISSAILWPPIMAGVLQFDQVSVPGLLILAVLANIAYCTVYPVDLVVQATPLRHARLYLRWMFWGAGTLLAAALAWLLTGFTANSALMDFCSAGAC